MGEGVLVIQMAWPSARPALWELGGGTCGGGWLERQPGVPVARRPLSLVS